MGCASAFVSVGWACSSVLVGVSLRASLRSQPLCTKVSIPSGRTSETVTWRSTSRAEERTQASSDPAPTIVVSAPSRSVT
jgi:hypothetical protein